MSKVHTFNDGHIVRVVGLNTWKSPPDKIAYRVVKNVLETGYRHFECFQK